jgi:hypothetical protein
MGEPARWSLTPNWGTPGTCAFGEYWIWEFKPARFLCAEAPDPIHFGLDRRAWPSFCTHAGEGETTNVEAALDLSQSLTGTVLEREPAILNGQRRGTKDFRGRDTLVSQSGGAEVKGAPGRPCRCVWCRFHADAVTADKPSTR